MSSINAQSILSTAGAAAGTALAPGVGTAIGGALGNVIAQAVGVGGGGATGPFSWNNYPADVKAWHQANSPQAFHDWMKANYRDAYSSLSKVKALYPAWAWTQSGGSIVSPNFPQWYDATETPRAYVAMGIDYPATLALCKSKGLKVGPEDGSMAPGFGWPHGTYHEAKERGAVVMLPSGGTPNVPATAVAELDAIAQKVKDGTKLTPAEQRTWDATKKAAGDGIDLGTVLLLVGAAVIIYLATR